jgi:hypothetical protein
MEKDIDRIQKNAETDIVIRVDDYMGKKGVTIREFVKSERYTGFTKAGTRVPADKFKLFKQAINSIDEKDLESEVHAEGSQESQNEFKSVKKEPKKAKQVDLEETEF